MKNILSLFIMGIFLTSTMPLLTMPIEQGNNQEPNKKHNATPPSPYHQEFPGVGYVDHYQSEKRSNATKSPKPQRPKATQQPHKDKP